MTWRPLLRIVVATVVATLAASIAGFALVLACVPLLIGADMPNSRWLEVAAVCIAVAGTSAAFVVSFRETMQKLADR